MANESETKPAMMDASEADAEYANNVFFSATIWDLKLIFGELTPGDVSKVDWHTSVTVPWEQVKLMAYYLAINIKLRELSQGRIRVPTIMLPPEPPLPPANLAGKELANARELHAFIKELRQRFISEQQQS